VCACVRAVTLDSIVALQLHCRWALLRVQHTAILLLGSDLGQVVHTCACHQAAIWYKHQDNNTVTWRPVDTVQSSYVSSHHQKTVDEKIKKQQALYGYTNNIHETGLHMIASSVF